MTGKKEVALMSGQEVPGFQQTISKAVEVSGIGLHSGDCVSFRILPSSDDQGIRFRRIDLPGGSNTIRAYFDQVTASKFRIEISDANRVSVSTVEHLLSVLRALEIDNAEIEVKGTEIPILDGSARLLFDDIAAAGISKQSSLRRVIKILKPVSVGNESCNASLLPLSRGFELDFVIEYISPFIGFQHCHYLYDAKTYGSEIAPARTFVPFESIEYIRSLGLARGGSLDNVLVVKGEGLMNSGGLHFPDEFVRHKILDAIGDLYLAGFQIEGYYKGWRSGHSLNIKLLRALFADKSAWKLVYQRDC